ncbi:autotransporter domain-containing protein [Bradyrhizobium sp.]|uniref:autotransporter outer membrane beta-barrel domain-containing protein n=1 Tax=Bradyrhizobium sp. TaxID=376 RepID=UPI0027336D93|nr:autotransporter domain-containing protein [Bradyrhizobium sp.]MDP3075609.1 autotransporter domain-containing protein [Bradyrhizobium sp.]
MTGLTAAAGRRARAARSVLLATTALIAIELLAGEAAWADCAPAAANNVTAECTGTTINQGAGAPGTSAAVFGYGTGVQTGVTVNVANGAGNTVFGTAFGIHLDDSTVTNGTAASITGGQIGIYAPAGSANVINSGSIAGGALHGIFALSDATVTNHAAGSITGGLQDGVRTQLGIANVTNSGSIVGDDSGVRAFGGSAFVINSGTITGTTLYGVSASTVATVTNNTGGGIRGDDDGIRADTVNVTNFGSITGTTAYGIRAFNAGSSIFNAGTIGGATAAISFTGGGNTLTLAPGSVINGNVLGAGANTFQLGGTGAATFDVSQLGPAAQYRGFGTFNKIDSSIWTLTGTSTFAGDVNVNGGSLVVNGNLTSAVIMLVNPGGTLAGTGTVPITFLADGATLAPGPLGSGTGALTINDRVVFCTCSTYAVKVSGTGNDFAQVMAGGLPGDAFLAGAVRVSSPTSTFRFNSPYTILTTQGGLNGTTFDSLALAAPPGIAGTLSYTANDVLLTLISGLGQITGLNQNQRAVGTALDTAFNAGAQTGGLGAIFNGNVAQNLTQASGELATGAQQATFDAMNLFLGLLTDPFVAGRGDGVTGGAGATPFAEEGNGANAYAANGKPRSRSERDAYAAVYRKAPPVAETFTQRWRVWGAGYGGSRTTDGSPVVGSNDTTSRVYGGVVGADYRFSPFTLAGFALAGGGTNFSIANGVGSGRSDQFQAGAFVRHTVGPAYLSAALAYGWQDVTTDRTVTIAGVDRLRAQFNANAFSGRVEGGYRFATPWVAITPYAAGQFTTFDLPAYTEQVVSGANTFALGYASKSVTASRTELGLRADKSYAVRDGVLTLRGRFAWAHDFNTDRSIAAVFQTLPGASFVVNGATQAHDAALTTASAEMRWLNGFSAAATFEGEFSNVTRSYAGKGVVRYAW